MPFINEKLTQEEKAWFAEKAIPNPGNPFFNLEPNNWTINREEDVFLVWALENRHEPDEFYFVLGWKGIPLPVKLKENWEHGSSRVWELLSLRITKELAGCSKEILKSLREALIVYGFNGNPRAPFDTMNKHTRVECNF